MYLVSASFIISSLLALSVDAAPQAPPPASSVSPAPPPASPVAVAIHGPPDVCGPRNQLSFDPQDSCSSPPLTVTSAASFGVLNYADGSTERSKSHGYAWTTCNPVLDLICTKMFASNTTTGMWNFATGPATDPSGRPSAPCQMGFWIPNGDGAAGKTGTITRTNEPSNPIKPRSQCRNVFQTMLDVATSLNPHSLGSSINLVTNPGSAAGQFKLAGGSGTGSAFNAGYPSYVLAFDPDWQPPSTATCTDPTTGAPCPCDGGGKCDVPPQRVPPPLCTDSQSNKICACDVSPTCKTLIPGLRPICSDTVTKAPCDCADMATNDHCQQIR